MEILDDCTEKEGMKDDSQVWLKPTGNGTNNQNMNDREKQTN